MSKKKKVIIAVVIIAVIIIIFNVGLLAWGQISYGLEKSAINSTIESFITDISGGQYDTAYNLVADNTRASLSSQSFAAMYKTVEMPKNSSVTSLSLISWNYDAGKLLMGTKSMNIESGKAYFKDGQYKVFGAGLYKIENVWKIESFGFYKENQSTQ